ncbi:MAG: 50S ribosomal protein L17 [Bacteroidia bacterium]
MRHGRKVNHLGRKSQHRKAMLSNMASSLIRHKRITTTVAKAKALRVYVEPLLTKGKENTTHNRRIVFSYLQDKHSVTELFDEIGAKIADRPGGYTRIIKLGNRLGDNAEMAMMELVDYNETMLAEKASGGRKKRRRRGGKKSSGEAGAETTPLTEKKEETTVSAAEPKGETAESPVTEAEKNEADEHPTSAEATEKEKKDADKEDNKKE